MHMKRHSLYPTTKDSACMHISLINASSFLDKPPERARARLSRGQCDGNEKKKKKNYIFSPV